MNNYYDFVIIGGGLGGLESAYILSKKGFRVCVLEKNKSIGGTLQNFKLNQCAFSSGMHYLGSLDEDQTLNKLFRFYNILDGLKLKKMDPDGFDRFGIASDEYAYPMGWDAYKEKMQRYFPDDKKAVHHYVDLMQKVADSQDIYNLRMPVDSDIRTNPYLKTGLFPAINKITNKKRLQNALCALNFVYAGDKNTTPLYTHALINNYYIKSAYRIIGGSNSIAELLAKNIADQGGEIYNQKKVVDFIFKDKTLTGVKTSDGESFMADNFISNVHPAVTLEMIDQDKIRRSYRNRISNIPNTISVFGLHLRLKPGIFPLLNYNYYHFTNNDVWAVTNYDPKKWPEFFYLYTPVKNEESQYTECVSLYAYMRFDEVEQWAHLPISNRGEAYESWKQEKAEKLINLASQRFPELKANILDWIAAAPLTYRDYIGTPNGGMYGTLRDYHNPMASYVFPRTKIPNLYFTGQNINLHGMLGVSISALLTCSEFVGLHDLLKEINEA